MVMRCYRPGKSASLSSKSNSACQRSSLHSKRRVYSIGDHDQEVQATCHWRWLLNPKIFQDTYAQDSSRDVASGKDLAEIPVKWKPRILEKCRSVQ